MDSFKRVVEVLEDLNSKCKTPIISQDEFSEEYQNLEDFIEIPKQIEELVEKLKRTNEENIDSTVETLIYLHLKLSDCIWHIDQLHELVKRSAGNIRDAIRE